MTAANIDFAVSVLDAACYTRGLHFMITGRYTISVLDLPHGSHDGSRVHEARLFIAGAAYSFPAMGVG